MKLLSRLLGLGASMLGGIWLKVAVVSLVALVGGGAAWYAAHVWNGYQEGKTLKAQVKSLTHQTDAVTREIPKQQEAARRERDRVSKAFERAAHADDAQDPMPESTRCLYLELWGDPGAQGCD